MLNILSTISNSFYLMRIVSTHKSIKHWTFDYAYFIRVHSLCKPLFPWGKNLQPHLQFTLYNIYFNLDKPMILYHVVSHISISWILINYWCFMSFLVCNLLGIFRPYFVWSWKDGPRISSLNSKVFSWGNYW